MTTYYPQTLIEEQWLAIQEERRRGAVVTIKEAIHNLEQIRRIDGDAIVVYFDCPHCQKSFSPDRVVRVVKIEARRTEWEGR